MAGTLSVALSRKRWDLASLCLLLGALEAAHRLPTETLTEMIGLLGGDPDSTSGKGRRGRGLE